MFNGLFFLSFTFMTMTVKQYADSIQKSRFTVYLWIKAGKLPVGVKAIEICGRTLIETK